MRILTLTAVMGVALLTPAADPPGGVTAAVPNYYTTVVGGVGVVMTTNNGGTSYRGVGAGPGVLVTVTYMPWYNADDLGGVALEDLHKKLKDLVVVQVVPQAGGATAWEYDGPAVAGWSLEFGVADGGTYKLEQKVNGVGVGQFQNLTIVLNGR